MSDEYHHLYHDTNLNLNEVFSYVSEIFDSPNTFYLQSINLAKHLYNESVYPNIKEGEFYVALLKGATFEGDEVDVIGIFKTEKKTSSLKPLLTKIVSILRKTKALIRKSLTRDV